MSSTVHGGYVTLDSGRRRKVTFPSQAAMAKAELIRGEDFEDTFATTVDPVHREWLEATKVKLLANGFDPSKPAQSDPMTRKAKARATGAKAGAKAKKVTDARTARIKASRAKARAKA